MSARVPGGGARPGAALRRTALDSGAPRPPARHPRSTRLPRVAAALVVALTAAACRDAVFTDPAPTGPVSLAIQARLTDGAASLQDLRPVLEKADQLEVRFIPLDQGPILTERVPFGFVDGEARGRVEMQLEGDGRRFDLVLQVLHQGLPLFVALERNVELRNGHTTEVTPAFDPEVGSVQVTGVSTLESLGEEVTLDARALFHTGDPAEDVTLTFQSLDPDVLARVGGVTSNRFRAVGEGTARVRVVADPGRMEVDLTGDSATVEVRVEPRVTLVTVTPATATVFLGDTLQASAEARDRLGSVLSGRPVTWTSSDVQVATVDGQGRVVGRALGAATVTATVDGVTSGPLLLQVAPQPVVAVEVEPAAAELVVDDSVRLVATLRDDRGAELTGRPITWTSSDPAVAPVGTVDGNAVWVRGRSPGTATLTATSEGRSGTATLTVGPRPVGSVEITPGSASVRVGDAVRFQASVRDDLGRLLTGRALVWSSTDPSVVGVDGTGLATARGPGQARVVATSEGRADSALVSVLARLDSVVVTPATASLAIGQTQELVVSAYLGGGPVAWPGGRATWALSDPSVASLTVLTDSTAEITASRAGSTEITATHLGVTSRPGRLDVIPIVSQASAAVVSAQLADVSPTSGTATLDVIVLDRNGNALRSLPVSSYRVGDINVPAGRLSFTPLSTATGDNPYSGSFSAALVVDQSGSMGNNDPSDARHSAVKQFTRAMRPGDESLLYTFSSRSDIRRRTDFTSSPTGLDAAIDALPPASGGTALYDAGIEACTYVAANARNANRVAVLLTDGQDGNSLSSVDELIARCRDRGVKLFTVGFSGADVEELVRIPSETGGIAFYDTDVDGLVSAFRGAPTILRGEAVPERVTFSVTSADGALAGDGGALGTVTVDVGASRPASAPFFVTWSGGADAVVDEVLYFTDGVLGTDAIVAGLQEMERTGEIASLVVATGRNDAVLRLADGPDLVVYFNQNNQIDASTEAALLDWVAGGGRLIYADWARNARVLAALQASAGSDVNETSAAFTHDALRTGVRQPMPLLDPGWGIFTTGLIPESGGASLCAFPGGESCLVLGNGGRTAVVGFLNDTPELVDGRPFIRNLVGLMESGFAPVSAAEAGAGRPRSAAEPGGRGPEPGATNAPGPPP